MRQFIFCFSLLLITSVIHAQQATETDELLKNGEKLYQQKQYNEALTLFTEAVQKDTQYADAYLCRAYTKVKLNDLEGAITDLSIYLEIKPNQAEAIFSRGLLQYQVGRYDKAKADFIKVTTLPKAETNTLFHPESSTKGKGSNQIITPQGSAQAVLLNYLGSTETKLGNNNQALVYLDSAIILEPGIADYYVSHGLAHEGLKNNTAAIADYKKALTIRNDHPVALHNLGILQRKELGKTEIDYLEYTIESDSSMLASYLERAYQRMEAGYYKGALEDYVKALEINPNDEQIWLYSGLVREKLADFKGAFNDFTKAIELNDKFEKAWLNRGYVLGKMGRHQDAIENYTVALTHKPEYPDAFYNRALAYYKLKQHAKACEDLKHAELLGQKVETKVKKDICK